MRLGFDLKSLIKLRPFLYHLTAADNVPLLRRTRHLVSTARLLAESNRSELTRIPRRGPLQVPRDDGVVEICDQDPLVKANIDFQSEGTFEDVVENLNRRVYFWPGGQGGPIGHGLRHFKRYQWKRPVLLRAEFALVLKTNPGVIPELCAFNSGAPRCSGGKKSPRGNETFVQATSFPRRPSEVVEVTFVDQIRLPDSTESALSPDGPWSTI